MSTPARSWARSTLRTALSATSSNCSGLIRPRRLSFRARNSSGERGQEPTPVTGKSTPRDVVCIPDLVLAYKSALLNFLKESLLFDGLRQVGITLCATGQPGFEPFHVHHLAMKRVAIAHLEERAQPALLVRQREAIQHGEVTVVEWRRARQHLQL